jgi:hypothetical protein
LLRYVNEGGNLLITGPLDYDEHWHGMARTGPLKLEAKREPLTYHSASLQLRDRAIQLSFDQQKQNWLDALRFKDGSTLEELVYGKGRIFWAADPVELAEGTQPAADVYAYVANRLGIVPLYDLLLPVSPGILLYPTVLDDAVFYVIVSDAAEDAKIDLRDKLTGVRLTLQLPAQHAALAVIGKREKNVVARYGF